MYVSFPQVFRQRISHTENPLQKVTSSVMSLPAMTPQTPSQPQPSASQNAESDYGFIKDLLNSVRNASSISSVESANPNVNRSNPNLMMNSYVNPVVNPYQSPPPVMSQIRPPGNVASTSNYQPYAQNNYSNRPSLPPAIPGLNLAQNRSGPEAYSSYQSQYSASDPDARKNYPYGY